MLVFEHCCTLRTFVLLLDSDSCQPLNEPNSCIIGFYHGDEFVEGCTDIGVTDGSTWCAGQVDAEGQFVPGTEITCSSGCPKDVPNTGYCPDDQPIPLNNGQTCCPYAYRSSTCPLNTGNEKTNKILFTDPPECCPFSHGVSCPLEQCHRAGKFIKMCNSNFHVNCA